MKGRVTLGLRMIPDAWAADHGYGELVTRSYRSLGRTYSYDGPMVEHTTLRWNPGICEESVIFHYLYGRKPPRAFTSGIAGAQWNYKRPQKASDRDALVLALTAPVLEMLAA